MIDQEAGQIDPQNAGQVVSGRLERQMAEHPRDPAISKGDRSLGIMFDPGEPDGFRLNSLAGDDEVECRKHVKGLLKKIVEGGSLTVENDAGQDDGLATQKKIVFALTYSGRRRSREAPAPPNLPRHSWYSAIADRHARRRTANSSELPLWGLPLPGDDCPYPLRHDRRADRSSSNGVVRRRRGQA